MQYIGYVLYRVCIIYGIYGMYYIGHVLDIGYVCVFALYLISTLYWPISGKPLYMWTLK